MLYLNSIFETIEYERIKKYVVPEYKNYIAVTTCLSVFYNFNKLKFKLAYILSGN